MQTTLPPSQPSPSPSPSLSPSPSAKYPSVCFTQTTPTGTLLPRTFPASPEGTLQTLSTAATAFTGACLCAQSARGAPWGEPEGEGASVWGATVWGAIVCGATEGSKREQSRWLYSQYRLQGNAELFNGLHVAMPLQITATVSLRRNQGS